MTELTLGLSTFPRLLIGFARSDRLEAPSFVFQTTEALVLDVFFAAFVIATSSSSVISSLEDSVSSNSACDLISSRYLSSSDDVKGLGGWRAIHSEASIVSGPSRTVAAAFKAQY